MCGLLARLVFPLISTNRTILQIATVSLADLHVDYSHNLHVDYGSLHVDYINFAVSVNLCCIHIQPTPFIMDDTVGTLS